MRPRRTSVAWVCDASVAFDRLAADFVREGRLFRIVAVFLMQELCGSSRKSTNKALAMKSEGLRKSALLLKKPNHHDLRWHNPQAHIDCLGRVSDQADGNEIHAGFSVRTHIFQTDAARNTRAEHGAPAGRSVRRRGAHLPEPCCPAESLPLHWPAPAPILHGFALQPRWTWEPRRLCSARSIAGTIPPASAMWLFLMRTPSERSSR